MPPRQQRRHPQREKLLAEIRRSHGQIYHVVGRPVHWELERAPCAEKVDHVWITLDVQDHGLVRASLSTESSRNKDAGFDPRVRIGMVPRTVDELPREAIRQHAGLDYAAIESAQPAEFPHYDKRAAESLMLERAARAELIEVWGHPYVNRHLGVHNIHSMRGSCAMPEDGDGGDGGILFHYGAPQDSSELVLIKFCGQP